MTKYLHEERFVVTSQDKESLRKYAEGWERTFGGDKSDEDPCFVCGVTDHERVEVFGGTVQGCPQVPDNVLLAAPAKGFVGKSMVPDTDAIECKITLYGYWCNVCQDRFPEPHAYGHVRIDLGERPAYECAACCDTGRVVDPNADPSTFVTEADGLVNCDECAIRGKQLP